MRLRCLANVDKRSGASLDSLPLRDARSGDLSALVCERPNVIARESPQDARKARSMNLRSFGGLKRAVGAQSARLWPFPDFASVHNRLSRVRNVPRISFSAFKMLEFGWETSPT